jgi:dTDP-glucose 4,6-dehydratase
MRWLVTGGLGFIGSHFVRLALRERPEVEIVNLDAMTYAGNPANLTDVQGDPRYRFQHGDICEAAAVRSAIGGRVDAIVNFAAETHVDRSIESSARFLRTDALGTHVLLEAVRDGLAGRLLQVSTDEVYGSVPEGASVESDPLRPRNPYSASKAAGDLLALAFAETYGISVSITRGSNTYGPNQYPEKVVPLFVTNLLQDRTVPLYGDGLQIRDWLYVEDHARAVLTVLERGEGGTVYNISSDSPCTNIELAHRLIEGCGGSVERHLRHVTDRLGHDRRYALDSSRLRALGWKPEISFDDGLARTIAWYRDNESWWRPLRKESSSWCVP